MMEEQFDMQILMQNGSELTEKIYKLESDKT